MGKISSCPNCGSKRIKYEQIYEGDGVWKCHKCGYTGSVVIEDGNLEKMLKESRKMEKLERKLLRGR
ncbi:hypothetical protein [Methanobacterium oryzae]|uniref:hypothetical protein n=1 Tax=Methanobacterium oryzae TaxID=69540 RepID=UPI003D25A4AD